MNSLLTNKNEFIDSRVITHFNKIKFKSLREGVIFEVAEQIGFLKKEAELRQCEVLKEVAHDIQSQDTSPGSKPYLKTDEWFNNWHERLLNIINLLNEES